MLNLRVDDLTTLAAELEAAGIAVEKRPKWNMPGVGVFMRIQDPDGLPIELWEPAN